MTRSSLLVLLVLSTPRLAEAQDAATGWSLLEIGDVDGAEAAFEAAAAIEPAESAVGRAFVAAARGRWDEAGRLADGAIAAAPDDGRAWTIRCRADVAAHDFAASDVSCARAAAMLPDSAGPHISACAAALARYRWADAVDSCQAGLDRDDTLPELWWRLGIALSNGGRREEAVMACATAAALAPDDAMAHYCDGSVALERGDHDGAMPACQAAIEADSTNALAWYCRGMARLGLGDAPGAGADCERAAELAPDEALASFCLGRAAWAQGEVDAALAHFERAMSLNDALIESWGQAGAMLTESGRLAEAERFLREALERQPNADRYAALAGNLFAAGRFVESAEMFAEAGRLQALVPSHRANQAVALVRAGEFDPADEVARAAMAMQPEDSRWLEMYVGALTAVGELHRAAEVAVAIADAAERPASAQRIACAALVGAQRYADAEARCVMAMAADATDAQSAGLLGAVRILAGRAVDAEAREAIARGADDFFVHYNLGQALWGQNRLEEAQSALEAARDRDRNQPSVWSRLADVREALGDSGGAERARCMAEQLQGQSSVEVTGCGE